MKKINRLLTNRDFKTVLDNKKSIANKEYIIYVKKNELNHTRIGISVSSKLGNSVVRHKVKRQINEMLKEIINIYDNNDIVIIARNKYLQNTYIENKNSIKQLFYKLLKGEKK